jgi:hypothetical protein
MVISELVIVDKPRKNSRRFCEMNAGMFFNVELIDRNDQ